MPDPGAVVIVDFAGAIGIKRRPALVVSSALYHRARPDVVIAVVTSQVQGATAATDYVLADWASAGLRVPSAFRAYFATVHRAEVRQTVGRLSPTDWKAVQDRIRLALAV